MALALRIKQLLLRSNNTDLKIFRKVRLLSSNFLEQVEDTFGLTAIEYLSNSIDHIIDFEASKEACRLVVKPGVLEGE